MSKADTGLCGVIQFFCFSLTVLQPVSLPDLQPLTRNPTAGLSRPSEEGFSTSVFYAGVPMALNILMSWEVPELPRLPSFY